VLRNLVLAFLACLAVGCSTEKATPPASQQAASADVQPTPDAEGFVALSPSQLTTFVDPKAKEIYDFSAEDNDLKLAGKVRGYMATTNSYRDFTLRLDVRWPNAAELPEDERANANTGVLVFITGEDKIWPKCLEVQGKWSELGHIKSNAKDVTVEVRDDRAAREQARKPVGEWNSLEIVSKGGALTSILNGTKIAESDPTELREGRIGFQAERYDVEFRNVRIREE
jgi:hypothetical protein